MRDYFFSCGAVEINIHLCELFSLCPTVHKWIGTLNCLSSLTIFSNCIILIRKIKLNQYKILSCAKVNYIMVQVGNLGTTTDHGKK